MARPDGAYLLNRGAKRYQSYAATGNGGQLVVVIPSLDLVVGFTGGNYGAHRIWGRWLQEWIPEYLIPAVTREEHHESHEEQPIDKHPSDKDVDGHMSQHHLKEAL